MPSRMWITPLALDFPVAPKPMLLSRWRIQSRLGQNPAASTNGLMRPSPSTSTRQTKLSLQCTTNLVIALRPLECCGCASRTLRRKCVARRLSPNSITLAGFLRTGWAEILVLLDPTTQALQWVLRMAMALVALEAWRSPRALFQRTQMRLRQS